MTWRILITITLIGNLCVAQKDLRVKIGSYGLEQIKNNSSHYIDSTAGMNIHSLIEGNASIMNNSQKTLGYFCLLLFTDITLQDTFYLNTFDSLYPPMLEAAQELGFYKIVWVLDDINQYRNKNLSFFQNDTVPIEFNMSNELFDYDFQDLRDKLYGLVDYMNYKNEYRAVFREFLLKHQSDLIR